jgi:hypothetical protein
VRTTVKLLHFGKSVSVHFWTCGAMTFVCKLTQLCFLINFEPLYGFSGTLVCSSYYTLVLPILYVLYETQTTLEVGAVSVYFLVWGQ